MVFTTRLAGRHRRPQRLRSRTSSDSGSSRRTPAPTTPPPAAKSNASNRPSKRWLRAQPQPATITELQALLDAFVDIYNHHRPHRSLPQPATPAVAYTTRPKAAPDHRTDTHFRVRHDRVDNAGNVTLRHDGHLHHIGIGRAHAGTRVVMLIHDLDIRIIHAATGEILRQLTLDPTRHYQPTGKPPGHPPRKPRHPNPNAGSGRPPMSRDITASG